MMFFDPEFLDRRLAGKGLEPLSHAADPRRKPFQNQPSRSRIAVPLFSKPADYVPGNGPPLRPISLLPAGDSTAYILERVLLPSPGPAPSGKPLPKRMAYLIGWRDLRAASMVVPAMQVLEYVSPRTLEEFEAKLEQEVDDEKEKMQNEFKSGLEAPQQKKKKKRGRPPAHSQIKSAVVAEPVAETPTPTKPRHKKGGISLSTPQKSRLADFEWLSEDEGSPSRQIAEEQFQSLHGFLPDPDEGINVTGDTNDALATRDLAHPVRGAPHASLIHIAGGDPAKQKQPSASPYPEFAKIRTPVFADSGVQTLATNKHSLPPAALSVNESNWGKQPLYLPPSSSAPSVVQTIQTVQTQAEIQNPLTNLGKGAKVDQKPKQSKKRPRSEVEGAKTEAQEDSGWVVERIEDVEYYEVDGIGLVRYFKVSWEGDWPPDQKKTWEPEENIPPNLVRNFFKNSRNKRRELSRQGTGGQSHSQGHPKEQGKPAKRNGSSSKGTHSQGSSLKQGTLSWPAVRRQYKSVSEAFAAEDYDDGPDTMDDDGYEAEEEDLGGNGQNEYFVVTEDGDDDLHGRSLWPSAGALSSAFGVLGGLQ